jgi:hypothetical protein
VRAVDAADFAVLAAQQAGVATGCLDALCARLRLTARDADRCLAAAQAAGAPPTQLDPVLSALATLVTAAGLIEDAAAAAVAAQSRAAAGARPPAGTGPDTVAGNDPDAGTAAIAALIAQAARDAGPAAEPGGAR